MQSVFHYAKGTLQEKQEQEPGAGAGAKSQEQDQQLGAGGNYAHCGNDSETTLAGGSYDPMYFAYRSMQLHRHDVTNRAQRCQDQHTHISVLIVMYTHMHQHKPFQAAER